jgi:glucose/arabinose dehydrogenase
MGKIIRAARALGGAALLIGSAACAAPRLDEIKLPPGFRITLYAQGVEHARAMALGERGTLFVGTAGDSVYAIAPGGAPRVIARRLNAPHGVAFRDGALYVAEIGRILRYDGIESRLDHPPQPVVVADHLPREGHHGLKTIRFGPDGLLYVATGSPCNVCEPDARHGIISRLDASAARRAREVYARGIRNSVGFDWDPRTKELWFTDNGADNMGNDVPPDELNQAPRAGMNFGFPYCHGGDVPDPRYGSGHPCSEYTPPARKLGAHVAALGMRFYTGSKFPEEYRGAIFIAEHGSWNRNPKSGYRVTVVRVQDGRALSYEPFAQGWLQGDDAWGRPVDVIVAPDGALLVSDDRAGAIYRIDYAPR